MVNMICVAIPVIGTEEDAVRQAREAVDLGAKYIEYRFDFSENYENLDYAQFAHSVEVPVIFTFRSTNQGGMALIEESRRQEILLNFVDVEPEYIDVEWNSDKDFLADLIARGSDKGVKFILSWHDLEKTPPVNEIEEMIEAMKTLPLDFSPGNSIVKIVTPAVSFRDNLTMLRFCRTASAGNFQLIAFCMGQLGILSRVLSPVFGGKFSYASIGEKTAIGQIHITDFKEMYDMYLKGCEFFT